MRDFTKCLILLSLYVLAVSSEHIQYRLRRREIPIRGVNLGGWLVVEKWMTGDSVIWKGVPDQTANQGEFKTMQFLGHQVGDARFEQHRATWITEADIAEIARSGLNTVRVPIGFWIVGFDNNDPGNQQEWKVYAPGALKYLDMLIRDWANKYNVAVLISFHAVKGSQSGMDHSSPPDPGKSYWGLYKENVDNAIAVNNFLAERYKNEPAFLGIGMLNEPSGSTTNTVLKDYYTRSYDVIRRHTSAYVTHAPLLYEQGPNNGWSGFFSPPLYYNCLHEWHKYLIWGFEGWSEERLMSEGINLLKNELSSWKGNWLFIGEFSVAAPQPFWDTNKFRKYAKDYFEAMNIAYGGWTYWSWRVSGDTNPGRSSWSMRNLIRNGDIPKSLFAV